MRATADGNRAGEGELGPGRTSRWLRAGGAHAAPFALPSSPTCSLLRSLPGILHGFAIEVTRSIV